MELAVIIAILAMAVSATAALIIIASLINGAWMDRRFVKNGSLHYPTTIRLSSVEGDNEEHCLKAAA